MAEQFAETFKQALWTLEGERDLEPLVALYAQDSTTGNAVTDKEFTGPEGAREFWRDYRGLFGDLRSEFRNSIEVDGRVALEWVTTGTMDADGRDFSYEGVSIIEHDGAHVIRFRAFFNSRDLNVRPEPIATEPTG